MKRLVFLAAAFLIIFFSNTLGQSVQKRVPFTKLATPEATPAFKVDTITDLQEVANILLGPGITLLNVSFTGDTFSLATFVDTTGTFGIDSGLVMSTGSVYNISGPNVSGSAGTAFGLPGDSNLSALIPGYVTHDAVILEVDFIPLTDTLIATEMIFGSEEYPEWVNSSFNDVFGFFLSDSGTVPTNVAFIPGTQTPITIDNVNASNNSAYYHDNTGGQLVEFDGYTVPMPLQVPVTLGNVYHLKIAIADAGDEIYDSGIFLKKNSLIGFAMQPVAGFTPSLNGPQLTLTNTSQYARFFEWDFGDGNTLSDSSYLPFIHTYGTTGQFQVKLVAHNFYKSDTAIQTISVTATGLTEGNQTSAIYPIAERQWMLRYDLPESASINVCSIDGRVIQKIEKTTGKTEVPIDLGDRVPGLYLIQSHQQGATNTLKVFIR